MKTFLATFIGIIAAFVVMIAVELTGHSMYPIDIDVNDPSVSIPSKLLMFVLIGHALGQIIGLLVARLIDKLTAVPVYLISGFLFLGTVANLFMISHPVWFIITDVAAVVFISAFFIYKATRKVE